MHGAGGRVPVASEGTRGGDEVKAVRGGIEDTRRKRERAEGVEGRVEAAGEERQVGMSAGCHVTTSLEAESPRAGLKVARTFSFATSRFLRASALSRSIRCCSWSTSTTFFVLFSLRVTHEGRW